MLNTWQRTAVLFLACLIAAPLAGAADVKPLPIGSPAPDFNLPGVDGRNYSLKDFASAKVLVIVFTCDHCPTAQAYEDRIKKLDADYRDKGVALVAISPNDPKALRLDELGYTDVSDSFEEMKFRAKDHDFKFPYLYDGETQAASHAYGVLATPHVFIFDQDRKLRYAGGIDNSDIHEVTANYARDAIDDLLAGRPVRVEKSRVFGCSTKWAEKREEAKKALAKYDAEPVELKTIDVAGVKDLVKNDSKKLRVINIWATWCGPCVAELPEFVTMNRMYRKRKFEMITISMDDPQRRQTALDMLKQLHVSSTNYLFTGGDPNALAEALDSKWEGPVPYTLIVEPGGKIIYRKTGEIDPLEVRRLIVNFIGRTYAGER